MTSMNIPEPVMSLAIMPKTREASGGFSKALGRFQKEDPTFKVCTQHQPSVLTQAAAHSHPWNVHAWHSLMVCQRRSAGFR